MSDRYRRSPRALHRNAGPEVLVVPADTDELVTLSGVAAVVWEALARPADAHRIEGFVAEVLDVAPGEVAAGLGTCLLDLTTAGVIEREGSAAWR